MIGLLLFLSYALFQASVYLLVIVQAASMRAYWIALRPIWRVKARGLRSLGMLGPLSALVVLLSLTGRMLASFRVRPPVWEISLGMAGELCFWSAACFLSVVWMGWQSRRQMQVSARAMQLASRQLRQIRRRPS